MSQVKKISYALSFDEFKQLEECAKENNSSIDELTSKIIKKYLKSKKEEELKKGYKKMAQINLELAHMCFDADEETLKQYEEKITECE